VNINIISGKCSEQNINYIFSLLKKRDKSKKHLIIAPDRSLFSLERRLFDELQESCFFDVNVMSLSKLANSVKNVRNRRILSKQSGTALVKKILTDNSDKLKSFGKCSNHLGFASSLFETICLYKSCNISCDDVFVDNSNSYSNLKQHDIKLVYTEYERYLQNDFTDSLNELMAFASVIDKDTFKDTIFYFVDFDDFTSVVQSIIAKIGKYSNELYITCTYNKTGKNKNIYLNKVYYDLIGLFKYNGLPFNIVTVDKFNNEFSNYLLDNLFSFDTISKIETDNSISINSFNNINNEVRYCIADIYKIATEKNITFDNFAIVVPSIDRYKKRLISEFDNYNIGYYFDENELLINHPIIHLLFAIVDLITDKFTLADFTNILKSPILNFDYDKICDVDNYLKEIDARKNVILKNDYDNVEINEFIKLLNQLDLLEKEQKGNYYTEKFIVTLFDYIIRRSEEYISKLSPLQSRIYSQIVNKFENIIKDYLNVFGEVTFKINDFSEVLKSYFNSTNISMPPITSNTIFVADINNSYLSKYDYIYVLGCNEGLMPSFKVDNGIVTDEDISKLLNGNKITPTISMINSRKLFKVFELMFKYREKITLSYPMSEGSSNLFPNSLIGTLTKNFNISINNKSYIFDVKNFVQLDKKNIEDVVFPNQTPIVAKKNLLALIKHWDICKEFGGYRKVVSSISSSLGKEAFSLIDSFGKEKTYPNIKGINLLSKNKSSITQIQNFYKCPYKHFIDYGLRLQNAPTTKIEPQDIGTIIHEALYNLLPIMLKGDNIEKDELYIISNDILEKTLNKNYLKFVENVSNRFVIKSLKKEFVRISSAIYYQISECNFKPKKDLLEVPFDNAIEIDGVRIDGVIDRVDTLGDKFIIIDYKTGDNSFSDYSHLYYGKKLQLLLYANAFEKKSGNKCVGAFYMPISNDFGGGIDKSYKYSGVMIGEDENINNMDRNLLNSGYASRIIDVKRSATEDKFNSSSFYDNMCLTDGDFRFILDYSLQNVKEAIERIKIGEIKVAPLRTGNFSTCGKCKYKALCEYNGGCDITIEKINNIEMLKEKIGGSDGTK